MAVTTAEVCDWILRSCNIGYAGGVENRRGCPLNWSSQRADTNTCYRRRESSRLATMYAAGKM